MRLSRLSNKQLKRLLARGEVRFGDERQAIKEYIKILRSCQMANTRFEDKIRFEYDKIKTYLPKDFQAYFREAFISIMRAKRDSEGFAIKLEKYLQQGDK